MYSGRKRPVGLALLLQQDVNGIEKEAIIRGNRIQTNENSRFCEEKMEFFSVETREE